MEENNKYMGYEITDKTLKLTNEKVFEEIGLTEEDLKHFYNEYKDCSTFIKSAKLFNNLYSNDLLKNSYQNIINETVNYSFDVDLVLADTTLLYIKLEDNTELLKTKKKTKLLAEKVEPKTDYIMMVALIELAMKHIKLLDKTTQKQVIALVMQTIKDSLVIDNIKYL